MISVKTKLQEKMESKWKTCIHNKPKLRTYVHLKEELTTADYVKFCNRRDKRSLMVQFRLGVLPLKKETAQYLNQPISERFCDFCKDVIEKKKLSESHSWKICLIRKQCLVTLIKLKNL